MIKAVLWDLGGVVTTSPFEAFAVFEKKNGLPPNFIRTVNATNPDGNAWARLERSEITLEEFDLAFERESGGLGHPVRGTAVLELLWGEIRPKMVDALRRCAACFKTACLTNNINVGGMPEGASSPQRTRALHEIMDLFDVVIESSKMGVRKPDARFYQMACEMLNIMPEEAVFLDDLGVNLKPARAMGMHTIKVTDPDRALKELQDMLGIPLIDE
ncbi:MAG: HAD-IA family hydrolase [Deltaproteobacteria bacterium]|nr:HAD-IA family hydrolase [Deltaproteobacteria bacterium]MBW1817031.1 HAD-IA family hydrolase [Deltaproteobacteria bacterium]